MSYRIRFSLIPGGVALIAVLLKASGWTLYRKNMAFDRVDKQIQMDIKRLFLNTLARLADFNMDLPEKITILKMENEEGNTFSEPFLVGNSREIRAYHYIGEGLSKWCSGIASRTTRQYFEHKNRRIDVTLDCNCKNVFPPLKTIIGAVLTGMFFITTLLVFRLFSARFEVRSVATMDAKETPISFEESFLEIIEKWDSANIDSGFE